MTAAKVQISNDLGRDDDHHDHDGGEEDAKEVMVNSHVIREAILSEKCSFFEHCSKYIDSEVDIRQLFNHTKNLGDYNPDY